MRTIRHKLRTTAEARDGYGTSDATFFADVTIPWENGPAHEHHGSFDVQVTFYIEGPDGDVEVTLTAEDTSKLAGAILEAREYVEWKMDPAVTP